MTQEELSAQSGVDRRHIGKIETGELVPGYAVLKRLADALGLTVRDLAEPLHWWDDEKKPTVETMDEIVRALRGNPDLDEMTLDSLVLVARTSFGPHLEEARRRKKRAGERKTG